jgi:subtilisin family serine protease
MSVRTVLTALALLAAFAVLPAAATPASDAAAPLYIVLHKDPPLAASVTGAKRLDVDSATSRAYLARLAAQQNGLLDQIGTALGRPVKAVHRYNVVLNGFALQLSPSEAQRVAKLPGVARVAPDEEQQLLTDNGPPWIGAPGIWDGTATGGLGTKGEGVVVGVIDTGVNIDHPSFADVGPVDGHNHTNPRGKFFGLCDPVTGRPFCNDKLIGVYDFTGTGPDDEIGHGSHTASTAAGNVLNAAFIAPTLTLNRQIRGVAPHANLITYKACQVVTGNCLLSGILAAINQATLDEVDVINYSIGGSSVNPWEDLDAQAFLGARSAGVFVSASAGNAGPGASTIGSPADAPWVMAVGASTHDRKFVNALVDMAGGGAPPANIPGKSVTAGYGPAAIVYAGAAPYNNPLCNPFPNNTFSGQIVVCDRGVIGRVEKGNNVKNAGGRGMVLVNDQPNGDSLIADPHVLPAVHISFANGETLKSWLASGSGHTARIAGTAADITPTNGDVMASFSSRGPNPSVGDVVKPDSTAPGVDIFAAFNSSIPPGPNPEFGIISGTSMSSPHNAGAAALLRALHPAWTPDEVRSALMTTAFRSLPGSGSEVHGVLKEDSLTSSDPFDRGAGRDELRLAGKAGLVLDETSTNYENANPGTGGNPRELNLPSMGEDSCASTCTWTRVVKATTAASWSVTTSGSTGLAITVSPSSFTLLVPGASQTLTITADVRVAAENSWNFGEVILTPATTGVPEAHLTVAAKKAGGNVTLVPLHFHGNSHDGCTGVGGSDVAPGGCDPTLSTDGTLDTATAAGFTALPALNCSTTSGGQCAADPNWIWELSGPTTLKGPMTVEWWVNCPGCNTAFFDDWFVRLWADGTQVFEGRVRFNTTLPASTGRLRATVVLPELTASTKFVLQLDPIFINQIASTVLYDSTFACPGGSTAPCDSVVHMPVVQAPANTPPDAVNDAATVARNASVDIDVLANDTDANSDSLTIDSFTQGANGTVTQVDADTLKYQNTGATASDSFTYTVSDGKGGTDTATVNVTVTGPDLVVAAITVTSNTGAGGQNQQPRQGQKATVTGTIANNGTALAPPTQTTFVLDDTTVLGVVTTPGISAGESVNVSVNWDTRGVSGEHTIKVTADSANPDQATETNETNNVSTLTVTVQGNKVKNGSFEQSSTGSAPDNWSSSGETGTAQGGSDGERSVTAGPTGSWLSDAIDVQPGRSYGFSVDATGAGGTVTIEQLSATGTVLGSLALPFTASPMGVFSSVTGALTVAEGVAQVRVRLAGSIAGTAGFDNVWLWES